MTASGPELRRCDFLVLGSGPAGQKAAVAAVKAGRHVVMIEQERGVGGACVHRGTIPSKTLRESALQISRLQRNASLLQAEPRSGMEVAALMTRLDEVVGAHVAYMGRQIDRNGIERQHGRAHFISDHVVEMLSVDGKRTRFKADAIFIATGSRPRNPPEIAIDHENILDSDSVLSMLYLPASLTVLGGGVIASEYASIFAALGVKVTMIDKADRPLKFMDAELVGKFVEAFGRADGTYLGAETIADVRFDGGSQVLATLASGKVIASDKMLVALGRAANIEDLNLAAAGLAPTARGLLAVDGSCRTAVPHIYAVGDVIGPPSLAATAMEQGRRAATAALGLPPGQPAEMIPIGIYTIPEMASVGLGEDEATRRCGGFLAGRARFDEVARGQISGITDGLLKLIADPTGQKLLGVHIVGDGATELVHVGQMALLAGMDVEAFVENIFNFPTLAEAYRVAALDLVVRRPG
ncbi:MAG: Si-specific NAD(P)(+) transhydrogenase [Deltaproteobacteria bacterium]|nr:Si-specific NAD(P)(+) transhydrogenase [Deltaproteobacteria bacterium]